MAASVREAEVASVREADARGRGQEHPHEDEPAVCVLKSIGQNAACDTPRPCEHSLIISAMRVFLNHLSHLWGDEADGEFVKAHEVEDLAVRPALR